MKRSEQRESNEKLYGGITGKGFKPGKSGNPGGRPKSKPLTEAYERLLADRKTADAVAKAMERQARKGNVRAAQEMADRVEGKIQFQVVGTGEDGAIRVIVEHIAANPTPA
jgi:hypothetical protein